MRNSTSQLNDSASVLMRLRASAARSVQPGALVLALLLFLLAFFMPAHWLERSSVQLPNSALPPSANTWFFRAALLGNSLLFFLWWVSRRRGTSAGWKQAFDSPAVESSERTPAAVYLGLALLVLLAAGLRFWKLGGGLWFDEIIDLVYYVRGPVRDILIRWPGQFPQIFFDLMAKISIAVFGETPWAYRLPAAIFGTLGVWAIFLLTRLLVNTRDALLAALLLATSYHDIFFSQDARGYTMQILFTMLATAALLRVAARNTGGGWAEYGIASILNIYTQFFSVFVTVGLSLGYLGRYLYQRFKTGRAPAGLVGFLWASGFIASVSFLLYSPMMTGMLLVAGVTARQPYFGPQVSGEFTGELLQGLRAGYGLLPLPALAAVGLIGFGSLLRRNAFGTALLVLPLAAGLISAQTAGLGVHPRFFLFALPAGVIILVRGLVCCAENSVAALRLREPTRVSRWVSFAAVSAVAVVSLARLVPYYRAPKQDFSGALSVAEQRRKPDEPLLAVGLAAHAYKAYYAPGIQVARTVEEVRELRRGGHRVWLLYTLPVELRDRNPELLKYIQKNFQIVQRFPGTIGNGTLYLCRAEPLLSGEE